MLSDPHQMLPLRFASVSIKLCKTIVITILFSSKSRDHQTKFPQCKVSKINSIRIKKGKTSDKKKTGSESAEQLVPDFLQLESVTADIRCHSSPQRDLRHFSSYFALFILKGTFHLLNRICATFHLLFFALFILFCIFHLLNEVSATFQLLFFALLFPEKNLHFKFLLLCNF